MWYLKMKKTAAVLLCLSVVTVFAACTQNAADTKAAHSTEEKAEEPVPQPDAATPEPNSGEGTEAEENPYAEETELPRIDGSTATIPLSEGLAQRLLGMNQEKASTYVVHNKTHQAYVNLLEGQCDIIFVTPPSEYELSLQEEYAQELEIIPVVNDAFVFLVNQNNPVESLTLEEIRGIYRGEITNWNQVGGADQPVTAFQRPDESGSQTLFYKLILPKGEAAAPPTELAVRTMEGLVEAVSNFDSGESAIGYSVFYYAKEMYPGDHSRLLAVDGIMPGKETIERGEYPLNSPYYAVIRKDSPADSLERKLIAYILTDEGQRLMEECGYIPLRELADS